VTTDYSLSVKELSITSLDDVSWAALRVSSIVDGCIETHMELLETDQGILAFQKYTTADLVRAIRQSVLDDLDYELKRREL
jgi:hypothetical protein